ncbi:MAG TPA: hypothetical protein DCE71_07920 [Parachlamydiales bacterium]|nr:hypothetical protein [Parachlamydiales bacterium]
MERPIAQIETIRGIVKHFNCDPNQAVIIGVRGFFSKENKINVYDDAIFLTSPRAFQSFNANTDPSYARTGIATLKSGLWKYKLGIHGLSKPKFLQYKALVQADQVTVMRQNKGPDTGWFGINIHKGSRSTTSSLGCQTIHPDQWSSFITSVESEMKIAKQTVIPYVLVDKLLG